MTSSGTHAPAAPHARDTDSWPSGVPRPPLSSSKSCRRRWRPSSSSAPRRGAGPDEGHRANRRIGPPPRAVWARTYACGLLPVPRITQSIELHDTRRTTTRRDTTRRDARHDTHGNALSKLRSLSACLRTCLFGEAPELGGKVATPLHRRASCCPTGRSPRGGPACFTGMSMSCVSACVVSCVVWYFPAAERRATGQLRSGQVEVELEGQAWPGQREGQEVMARLIIVEDFCARRRPAASVRFRPAALHVGPAASSAEASPS